MSTPQHQRTGLRRRQLLGYSAAGAAAVMLGTGAWDASAQADPRMRTDPFTVGVASGDPEPTSVVLWTRLAPELLAPDGSGGMPDHLVPVRYQVATDENFTRVVRHGVVHAAPELGHSVHPEIRGLEPGREYWYRFRTGSHISPVGRTRTAPAPGTVPESLRFAIASCQSYHGGLYTSYQHLAEEDLDLVLHLGDYIYEQSYGYTDDHDGNRLPDYMLDECFDLPAYRLQYALYKSDLHLQNAHARAPWISTFDDHEVENDWRADVSEDDDEPDQDPEVFRQRKQVAFQAMYENLPLRRAQMPSGPDIRVHRRLNYGELADFTMLDTRQYRSAGGRTDPDATMLGGKQRSWLTEGFSTSRARWQIIGNQQPMAQVDRDPDPDVERFFEAWDEYAVEREHLLGEARDRGVENLVVVTGDRHTNYMLDLKADYDDPDSAVLGTEIVGTSISSSGDGADIGPVGRDYLRANPHMKFFNYQRGYVRIAVTPAQLTADYRVVEYVSRPGAPIKTRASFVVEDGSPGAQPA